jgi:NitT/TauT family transport system substrate-binding protein
MLRISLGYFVLLAAAIGSVVTPAAAQETHEVRIVQQFGLSYLPLHVAVEQKLIEKYARAAGLGEMKVTLSKLGSGAAVNDALLSGSVDIAMA